MEQLSLQNNIEEIKLTDESAQTKDEDFPPDCLFHDDFDKANPTKFRFYCQTNNGVELEIRLIKPINVRAFSFLSSDKRGYDPTVVTMTLIGVNEERIKFTKELYFDDKEEGFHEQHMPLNEIEQMQNCQTILLRLNSDMI